VRFGLGGGAEYEIDVNKKNARAFRRQLAPFAGHARKAGRGPRRRSARTAASRDRGGGIRAWAKDQASQSAPAGASRRAWWSSMKPPPQDADAGVDYGPGRTNPCRITSGPGGQSSAGGWASPLPGTRRIERVERGACFSLSHNPECVSHREMERSASLLHPRSALVMAVRSSSPALAHRSNLAIRDVQAFVRQAGLCAQTHVTRSPMRPRDLRRLVV
jgi:hypothetical protein